VRGISREVLARDAAARLDLAACKHHQDLWNERERDHANAGTQAVARQAALPLLAVCTGCPVITECRAWAKIDDYTGIAAGTAWVNGLEKPTHWVRRQAPRRIAS